MKMKAYFKRILSVFVICVVLLSLGENVLIKAETYLDNNNYVSDGYIPAKNNTIIHIINDGKTPYTKIANKVTELYVGEHHRLTVALNGKKTATIRWYSSNKAVATIGLKTGNITANAPGKTTITMKDTKNNKTECYLLMVKANPILPMIPQEWYTVKEKTMFVESSALAPETVVGVCLDLKSEYADLYAKCSMLRIPNEIDGVPVIDFTAQYANQTAYDYYSFAFNCDVFSSLKLLQAPQYIANRISLKEIEVLSEMNNCKNIIQLSGNDLHIPESAKYVCADALEKKGNVRIPASVKLLYHVMPESGYCPLDFYSATYSVDGNNTNYYSIFGVLFSYPYHITSNSGSVQNSYCIDTSYGRANCRSLITYPKDKKDKEYYVPEGVERIEEKAFQGNQYLKKIVLPDTVREIGIGAFADLKNDVEIVIPASTTEFGIYDDYTIVGQDWSFGSNGNDFKNVTIVTPKGSAAEKYAKKYKIKYRNE